MIEWKYFNMLPSLCSHMYAFLHRKGATMHPTEIRSIVTDYVKKNELVDENNKK